MWRLRFLKILLPAILIPFVILVILEIQRRPPVAENVEREPLRGSRASGVEVIDLEGPRQRLKLKARTYAAPEDGKRQVEGVERLVVARDDATPLIVVGGGDDRGSIRGEAPNRHVEIEGGLEVRDEDAGLVLRLPRLEVDEAAGLARSTGGVTFSSPGYQGRADEVLYDLAGGPIEMLAFAVDADDGSHLRADRALFLEGNEELELEGDVRLSREVSRMNAPRMRVKRDPDTGRLQRVDADGGVSGHEIRPGEAMGSFRGERLELTWDEAGEVATFLLTGGAFAQQGDRGVAAETMRAWRPEIDPSGWEIEAEGEVVTRGVLEDGPATLRSETLRARSDAAGNIQDGTADGSIHFEGGGAIATGDHAELVRELILLRIDLTARDDRKARLGRDDTRVAADRIVLWPGTKRMRAIGRTDATLMPSDRDGDADQGEGLFRSDDPLHFVSEEMDVYPDRRVTFRGNVRGWQGERNLSADEIDILEGGDRITATGSVNTRLPRRGGPGTGAEAEFLHVSSDSLDYDRGSQRAVYEGDVRMRQAEGWIEGGVLEVHLGKDGGDIELIRALGDVRLEYTSLERGGDRIKGSGDRMEYRPADETVRLFGDRRHASLTRPGSGGGTTLGRVLSYDLGAGTIEVEAGDQDRARIRTGKQ